MEYISISEFARKYEAAERTVRYWCTTGKIHGAFLTGKTWNIPSEAEPPAKGKSRRLSPPIPTTLRAAD